MVVETPIAHYKGKRGKIVIWHNFMNGNSAEDFRSTFSVMWAILNVWL